MLCFILLECWAIKKTACVDIEYSRNENDLISDNTIGDRIRMNSFVES